jgi:hypothetical protein
MASSGKLVFVGRDLNLGVRMVVELLHGRARSPILFRACWVVFGIFGVARPGGVILNVGCFANL